ncbi:MAG: zincin-like metallopeptidase domain-containing protein [Candidatus Competibacteraceae bacterium]|nr:zincin-like metallopeptidase domain-containing protein [Candidatus Competibacteraceae bacterium]
MSSVSLYEHQRAVLDAMHAAGCAPVKPEVIVFDGVLHRFQVEGDKKGSRNGWLVLYGDDLPAGKFGSWKTGVSVAWCATAVQELTPAQRREREREIAKAQARRRREELARQARAQARANRLWRRANPTVDFRHPYLVRKQVPAIGLRQLGDNLLVPIRDPAGTLYALQFINPQGGKRFLKHSAIEGHYHTLGNPNGADTLLLCEGYATGVSLHRITHLPVVIAFNAGNLLPVAQTLRQHFPQSRLVIAADDDRLTTGNPGRTFAEDAARAVNGAVMLPDFTGLDTRTDPTDFNDLQVLGGLPRLRVQLVRALQSTPVIPAPVEFASGPPPRFARPTSKTKSMSKPARQRKSTARPRANLYQDVTDRIIAMIEQGTAPWQQRWDQVRHPNAPALPVNAVTGKPYHGINVLLLLASSFPLDDPRWCGFQQAKSQGWQVKAGERGTTIVFYKRLEIADNADDSAPHAVLDEDGQAVKFIPVLRKHTVFHASQIEGIPSLADTYGPVEALPEHQWQSDNHLDAILQRSGAHIHEGDRAAYRPADDLILLPPRERFPDSAAYYGVAFHELGHWTGHESRLNRGVALIRDSSAYAREELRAELTSAFLGAELGICHDLDEHAAYLSMYLNVLRQDNKEIFRAAKDAQGIADLIMDRHPDWQLEHGVCVQRTAPLPSTTPLTEGGKPAATAVPVIIPATKDTPAEPAPDEPVSTVVQQSPFHWLSAALADVHCAGEDDSELGRLSRQIDAAFAGVPQSVDTPRSMDYRHPEV